MAHAEVQGFFDPVTCTVTHVVADPATKRAAVIDSVLDYAPTSGRTSTTQVDALTAFVRERGLTVDWVLETHAHADHLSAAPLVQQRLGGRIAIGEHICELQRMFGRLFNARDIAGDGAPFEHLFHDGEQFAIGSLTAQVLHTPGHTPACVSYLVRSDNGLDVFIGDTLFMPDYGTARCDFPGGDARALYDSIHRLLALPADTRLHLCHDYPPAQRAPRWVTTVAEQRRDNVHIHDGVSRDDFVAMRTARDRTLAMPVLLLPAVQVNVRAGHWPPADDNGVSYLKIPLNAF